MSDLSNLAYTMKLSLRHTQQAYEHLAQSVLVEEKRAQDAANLLESALELIRDQQAFIVSVVSDNPVSLQEAYKLDARASTFTFIENFPQAKKKEASDGKE